MGGGEREGCDVRNAYLRIGCGSHCKRNLMMQRPSVVSNCASVSSFFCDGGESTG